MCWCLSIIELKNARWNIEIWRKYSLLLKFLYIFLQAIQKEGPWQWQLGAVGIQADKSMVSSIWRSGTGVPRVRSTHTPTCKSNCLPNHCLLLTERRHPLNYGNDAVVRICQSYCTNGLSQWPRGLRRRSTAAHPLRLWVRIPPRAWKFVCCKCCVLSGRGLCEELITRPEESYRLWRVVVCDQKTSRMRRLKPATGLWKIQPQGCSAKKIKQINKMY